MFANWYDILSGNVPGGLALLIFILISMNLLFWFFRKSDLLHKEKVKRRQITLTLFVLLLYGSLWLALRPPLPPMRITVLPSVSENNRLQVNPRAFYLAEYFEREARTYSLKNKYLLHYWEWLYETVGKDSAGYRNYWRHIARQIGSRYLVQGTYADSEFHVEVKDLEKESSKGQVFRFENPPHFDSILKTLNKRYGFFDKEVFDAFKSDDTYLQAKIIFLNKSYEQVTLLLKNDTIPSAKILRAAALVRMGLQAKIDRVKAQYVKETIPQFEEAKRLLYPLIRQRRDTPELAYWLGRVALFEEDYSNAEIFLKRALVDEPRNARIYYALSFLLPQRLKEIGYQSRAEILEKAVKLDPGYYDAVYDLANTYYSTGSGTQSGPGTVQAIKTIQYYLRIKKGDARMLSLLGTLYIKTQRYDEAEEVFAGLLKRFPQSSNSYYDMGVVYFMKKEYQKALPYFLKAIKMNQNLDAYLYAGITYRQLGENQQALKYYRERIKRSTGADDMYAKEAMRGIRIILADSLSAKEKAPDEAGKSGKMSSNRGEQ